MKTEIDIKRVIYRTFPLPTHTETNRASDSLIYYTNGGHRFEFENQTLVATEGNMVYLPYKSAYKNYTQIEDLSKKILLKLRNGDNKIDVLEEKINNLIKSSLNL